MNQETGNSVTDSQRAGILAEYNALRSEILKRIELRNSILFGTLTFAGVLLGFGIATPTLALMYVIISTFLAAAWVQNVIVVIELGRYIRDKLENAQTGLYWETHRQENRLASARNKKFQPSVVFSTGGVFLVTQTIAILIAFSNSAAFTTLEWTLSIVALIGILSTIYFFQYAGRQN
jgi:hypothetical protein